MTNEELELRSVARHFGLDPRLLASVERAEGDILKAVKCSIPECYSREKALEITARSAVHCMCDFVKAHYGPQWILFWSKRWAPVGAANDPKGLNANWPKNVIAAWLGPQFHSRTDTGSDVPGGGAA